MEIDWNELSKVGEGVGKDFLEVIKPYLPVLARSGHDLFEGFVAHLGKGDFESIDRDLYALMTVREREELERAVYADAYQAALAKFRNIQLLKEILLKLVVRLAIKVATGGVL